jgi:hypothetical protein
MVAPDTGAVTVGVRSGPAAACWTTVNVVPCTVMVEVRELPVGFEATEYEIVPPPLPLPLVTESQGAPALAVHGQPAEVLTAKLPAPPAAGMDAPFGDTP